MKTTIDNYDFEAEYNAMAAFNDINIMTSLIKTIPLIVLEMYYKLKKI